ncbi:unnamed protein product, partial [Allacma fusca]
MADMNLTGTLKPLPDGTVGEPFVIEHNSSFLFNIIEAGDYEAEFIDGSNKKFNNKIIIRPDSCATFIVTSNAAKDQLTLTTPSDHGYEGDSDEVSVDDTLEKHGEGKPYIRLIQIGLWNDPYVGDLESNDTIGYNLNRTIILSEHKKGKVEYTFEFEEDRDKYPDYQSTKELEVEINTYDIVVVTGENERRIIGDVKLRLGGSYILTVVADEASPGGFRHSISWVVEPNSINMLWLVPQYFIISSGEIMFQITIMDFCYSQ